MPAHNTRVQAFILSGYHGEPTSGTVTIHEFNREQRVRRALAGLGKWWGVALLCVLIPVAHFVLVPSFLLYGTWQFFQRLGTAELATGARGVCPDCGADARARAALAGAAAGHVPAVSPRVTAHGLAQVAPQRHGVVVLPVVRAVDQGAVARTRA